MDWASFITGAGATLTVTSAVGSALYARSSLKLARRAEKRELKDREQADREQDRAAVAEASLVEAKLRGSGGSIVVKITNRTGRPVRNVELLDVNREDAGPGEGWTVNQNVRGMRAGRAVLPPDDAFEVAAWLLDADGARIQAVPRAVGYRFRFRDVSGQWWENGARGEPWRVDPPEAH